MRRPLQSKIHAAAALQRWQDAKREEMQQRLRSAGVEASFVEEEEEDYDDSEEEEEEEEIVEDGTRQRSNQMQL